MGGPAHGRTRPATEATPDRVLTETRHRLRRDPVFLSVGPQMSGQQRNRPSCRLIIGHVDHPQGRLRSRAPRTLGPRAVTDSQHLICIVSGSVDGPSDKLRLFHGRQRGTGGCCALQRKRFAAHWAGSNRQPDTADLVSRPAGRKSRTEGENSGQSGGAAARRHNVIRAVSAAGRHATRSLGDAAEGRDLRGPHDRGAAGTFVARQAHPPPRAQHPADDVRPHIRTEFHGSSSLHRCGPGRSCTGTTEESSFHGPLSQAPALALA